MFKEFQGPNLKEEEITLELEKIQNHGWEIYVKKDKSYIIKIDDRKEISIQKRSDNWQIKADIDGSCVYIKFAASYESFISLLNDASTKLNTNLKLEKQINSIRIKACEPLTNKVKIISLAKGKVITKIFDPFFDTKSIGTLLSLSKLGINFGTEVQCLTTKSLASTDTIVLSDFMNELGLNFNLKKCAYSEHRRFLILNDNTVLIIGCSLNDINKNEVVYEEQDEALKAEDISFFLTEWTR